MDGGAKKERRESAFHAGGGVYSKEMWFDGMYSNILNIKIIINSQQNDICRLWLTLRSNSMASPSTPGDSSLKFQF